MGAPNGPSFAPTLSADGRYVAFSSEASNLVPGDSNGSSDVFVRDLDDLMVIEVHGRLAHESAQRFQRALDEVAAAATPRVDIDLQHATGINSTCLGRFMMFVRRVTEKGREVHITRLNPKLSDLFQELYLDRLVRID